MRQRERGQLPLLVTQLSDRQNRRWPQGALTSGEVGLYDRTKEEPPFLPVVKLGARWISHITFGPPAQRHSGLHSETYGVSTGVSSQEQKNMIVPTRTGEHGTFLQQQGYMMCPCTNKRTGFDPAWDSQPAALRLDGCQPVGRSVHKNLPTL